MKLIVLLFFVSFSAHSQRNSDCDLFVGPDCESYLADLGLEPEENVDLGGDFEDDWEEEGKPDQWDRPDQYEEEKPDQWDRPDQHEEDKPDQWDRPDQHEEDKPDQWDRPDQYEEDKPEQWDRPDQYEEEKPDQWDRPDQYEEDKPDQWDRPDQYEEGKPDQYDEGHHGKGCFAAFYEDEDFEGDRLMLRGRMAASTFDSRNVRRAARDTRRANWHGRADSIRVGHGARLYLYEDSHFEGERVVLYGGDSVRDLDDLRIDDDFGSFKLVCD